MADDPRDYEENPQNPEAGEGGDTGPAPDSSEDELGADDLRGVAGGWSGQDPDTGP